MGIRIYTTAPHVYDWGWTHPLVDSVGLTDRGKVVRLVEIEDNYHAEMQVGRYGSGLELHLSEDQFTDWVQRGYITLTPDKEIHYLRAMVSIEPLVHTGDTRDVANYIHSLRREDGVKLDNYGYQYHITVTGPKADAERKLRNIMERFNQMLAKEAR